MLIFDWFVYASCRIFEVTVPLDQLGAVWKRAIIAAWLQINFDLLYPSDAGLEMCIDFRDLVVPETSGLAEF